MISYSKQTKEALSELQEKKKCCKRIYFDICSLDGADNQKILETLTKSANFFKCQNCFSAYLKALFIMWGNVTDPNKRYHLELSFASCEISSAVFHILSENGVEMSKTQRKGRHILYIKDSDRIEEFFAIIGANKAAFELINSKIVRELREETNRQLNCDMANIKKTLSASEKYIAVIEEMDKNGTIVRLPHDLKETAKLRVENNQASMADLALMHSTPISKSGVKHRLDKILELSEDFKNQN